MLLEQAELLDGDPARIGVRAHALVADPNPDRLLRCRGRRHERKHGPGENRCREPHSVFSLRRTPAAGRGIPLPLIVHRVRTQSGTAVRQSMFRTAEFLYETAALCGRLGACDAPPARFHPRLRTTRRCPANAPSCSSSTTTPGFVTPFTSS